MKRSAPLAVAAAVILTLLCINTAAFAATPKTTLGEVEQEVMCVSCDVPLGVAEAPQADAQREEIRTLIAKGLSKEQIKNRLVAEYGHRVLAMPEQSGFSLAAYLVPVAVAIALIALAMILLPRWRRSARDRAAADAAAGIPPEQQLSMADSKRLDAELKRYEL
jgi:cytochrome c-type biogenesis protein CcmH/NrfF